MRQLLYILKNCLIDLRRLKNMSYDFPRVQVASVEKEIDLESKAENDGRNDLPREDSKVFSNCENEAITKYDDIRHKGVIDAAKYLEPFKEKITNLKSKIEQKHFYIDEFKNRIQETLTSAKGSLSTLKSSFEVQDREVRNFKLANNLTRDPRSLTPIKIIIAFLLVLGLFAMEVKVNTTLLAPALEGGEGEGQSISAAVAALNVFVSFLAGFFVLKNFHSVIIFRRRISQFGLFIYSFFIIYLNICLGAYRAIAEQKGNAIAWGQTETKVTELAEYGSALFPWTVSGWSFYAAVLTFVGILFAVLSLLDGYFFNDPYPGYGSLGKERNENKKEMNRIRQHLASEVNSIFKNEVKKTGDQRDLLISKDLTEWSKNITILENIFSAYRRFAKKIDDDLDHVIGEYRSKNNMYRKTGEPQYWKDENGKIKTRYYNLPDSKVDPEKVFIDTALLYLNKDKIQNQMKIYQEKISEESNQYLNKLSDYHTEINKEVDETINNYDVNRD